MLKVIAGSVRGRKLKATGSELVPQVRGRKKPCSVLLKLD